MPTLSPTTLTQAEQRTILRSTSKNTRDHEIYTLALHDALPISSVGSDLTSS